MNHELVVELALREHVHDRASIHQLHIIDRDLSHGGLRSVQPVLAQLLDELVRRLHREMRQEEIQLYPLLPPVLGSDVPVRALVAEHHAVRDIVYDLRRQNQGDQRGWLGDDRIPEVRGLLRRLGRVLELHLRREEAALGALVAARPPSAVPA